MKPFAILRFSTLVTTCCTLLCCGNGPEEKPKEKVVESPKPELVGRIASIPPNRGFVLIQAYGSWNVTTGTILTTIGPEGRAANLRATGEKLGQFAAADIQSGKLEIGDGVYTSVSRPKPSLEKTDPVTEDQDTDEETEVASEPPPVESPITN